jgi:hypothetical protein
MMIEDNTGHAGEVFVQLEDELFRWEHF